MKLQSCRIRFCVSLFVLVALFFACAPESNSLHAFQSGRKTDANAEVIIFDTDMGSDCDDAGALALLHHFADQGKARILCCIYSSSRIEHGVGVIDAINTYYGRPDVPIGASRANDVGDPVDKMKAKELALQTERFGHDLVISADAESDVQLMRRLLSKEEDRSVTYITVGHTRSIYDLLVSKKDASSDLTGKELVAAKLKRWVALGALRANNENGHFVQDWNFFRNGTSTYTEYVVRNLPVPIYFVNGGSNVMTGSSLDALPDDNILQVVYETWLDNVEKKALGDQRPSWDLVAVYYAVNGLDDFFFEEKRGYLEFDKNKGSKWIVSDKESNHTFVCQSKGVQNRFGKLLNRMIATTPKVSGRTQPRDSD